MPEELELNAQRKELVQRHKVPGSVVTKITNFKKKEKGNNFAVLKKMKKLLPLTIEDVQTRGKQIAIIFSNDYKLVFGMGSGGYFCVDDESKINDFMFKERANFCMAASNGKCIYVLECNNTLNQVLIDLKSPDEDTFDPLRGPDLIESSIAEFESNLFDYLDSDNKYIQKYFEKATLLDVLHNQSLFNGLGAYTTNEVLYWLWLLKGIRPWSHGASVLRNQDNRTLLIRVIRTYFAAMLDYLKPGTEDSKIDCNKFDERKWLEFRAIFIRCYRKYDAQNRAKEREVVSKYKATLVSCSYMKTAKNTASVYLVGITQDELAALEEQGWEHKPNNPFTPSSLGVGMYNWWGPKEKKVAVNSPVKEIQSMVNIRPTTIEHLNGKKGVKRKLDIFLEDEDKQLESPAKKPKLDGQNQSKNRRNKRSRVIHKLYAQMESLSPSIK